MFIFAEIGLIWSDKTHGERERACKRENEREFAWKLLSNESRQSQNSAWTTN